MRDNLRMIENMEQDLNDFPMVLYMKDFILMGNLKVKENFYGLMERVMKVNGKMD